MDPGMLYLLALGLIGFSGLAYDLVNKRTWRRAAARLDLEFTPRLLPWHWEISGSYQDFWIRITVGAGAYHGVIDGRGVIPWDLRLGAENLLTRTMAPDILTGDAPFDYEARITGSELKAIAVLDSDTREMVRAEVVRGSAVVEAGAIRLRGAGPFEVSDRVPGLVEFAKRLELSDNEVADRLAHNAIHDPEPAVRLRNLRLLHQHFWGREQTREASLRAAAAPYPELSLEGAIYLGELGVTEVVRIAGDEDADDDLRLRAIGHLTKPSWAEVTIPLLEDLLTSRSPRVCRSAIAGLGRCRHAPARARLEAMAQRADPLTAAAIAESLGSAGDAAAEPFLVTLLSHWDRRVRAAAARSLGRVGSALAVEPLLELARKTVGGRVKQACQEAIQRIQARLVEADKGGLSLAAPADHDGALSPVEEPDERGALSLEEEGESGGGAS